MLELLRWVEDLVVLPRGSHSSFCTVTQTFAYVKSNETWRTLERKSWEGKEMGRVAVYRKADYCTEILSFLHECKTKAEGGGRKLRDVSTVGNDE